MNEIEDELFNLLPHFESFFSRVGFKRIDGAVFGLLTFSKDALSSDEIEKILNLSQSAVSQSLKTLALYSMIETYDHKEIKRLKLHSVKEDAIQIVSSVIRKRELGHLQEFEKMSMKALQIVEDDKRKSRLGSILITTQFAKTVSQFLVDLTDEIENPYPIIEKLPQVFNLLKTNMPHLGNAKDQIQSKIMGKLGSWLSNGDIR